MASIELSEFGPQALYRWLFEHWDQSARLSGESKRAIKMLAQQPDSSDDELKKLATSFAYEPLVQALELEDFEFFVDTVIQAKADPPNLYSHEHLEYSSAEFRLFLSRTFQQAGLWPSQGFRHIVDEAIEAAARAKEALPQVNLAVNDLRRRLAMQSVHEGVDRALLCAERFTELLLEFLARIAFRAGAATQSEFAEWLAYAGMLPLSGGKHPDWFMKERAVSVAAHLFSQDGQLSGWDQMGDLEKFAGRCWGKYQKDKTTGKIRDDFLGQLGEVQNCFMALRQVRNGVRHASATWQMAQGVPEAYRAAAEQSHQRLAEFRSQQWRDQMIPAVVKVLSYNQDCFGGVELIMALEGERMVSARFINQDMLTMLTGVASPQELLVNPAAEFFIFPSASPDQTQIFHPLLLERVELARYRPVVRLNDSVVPEVQVEDKDVSVPLIPPTPPEETYLPSPTSLEILPAESPEPAPADNTVTSELTTLQIGVKPMTDPTGRSFLSYRRLRSHEATLLIAAQRDRGIPTWQDIENLREQPLDDELRRELGASETASAVLWITPEVAESAVIQRIEAPLILERVKRGDGFFVIPVLAGGAKYDEVNHILDPVFTLEDLRQWNLRSVANDPINAGDAAQVARWVLQRRLESLHSTLPKGQPLRLSLHTRKKLPWQPGSALWLDWFDRFDGREAKPGAWTEHLLPALEDVAATIEQYAPGRSVEADGQISLAAATALGCTFLATRRLPIAWRQYTPGRGEQVWSIDAPREKSGFEVKTRDAETSADDLAVLVMVNDNNVELAFNESRRDLPPFRAVIKIFKGEGVRHDLATPGMAADVAYLVAEELRRVRPEVRRVKCVHLFMAVPAGLAMMIGQLLNTFGQVQTYEHITEGGLNCYRRAALLQPAE